MIAQRIEEIVLTGGSCAGKTLALDNLAQMLRHQGHRVITVPEVATMIIKGGITDIGEIAREDGEDYCRFQREVFRTHRALRRRAQEMAAGYAEPLVVILYDRGELDGIAYHRHDCFAALAAEEDLTVDAIRDSYTAVMHLVTSADGAEDYYSAATNSARWDSLDEARVFDGRIRVAWAGHPCHVVVDNSTDWSGKLERLLRAAEEVLDVPGQLRIELSGARTQVVPEELELGLDSMVATPA